MQYWSMCFIKILFKSIKVLGNISCGSAGTYVVLSRDVYNTLKYQR